MDDIKKSMLALLSIKEDDRILTKFSMGKFQEKYPISFSNPIWYNGYEVIDENTIRVKYQYGGGNLEIDGHFDVKINE
jgi:hypothetical protein